MSATLLERPRPTVARQPAATPPIVPVRPRSRPGARALPIAIVISAAVHVIILGLRFEVPVVPRNIVPAPRFVNIESVPAMRAYDIAPVEADVPTPSPEVVPIEPVEAVRPNVELRPVLPAREVAEGPVTATPDPEGAPASIADRLAPRSGDPLLWARPNHPLRPELDLLNNVRARVYGQIDAYNDSIAAFAEAERRATDWTHRDANGDRWGVSPGKIHLGKVTLPLPFGFSVPSIIASSRAW
ncbi:MAG: hypothetical protein ACRELX_16895 [Longimicrobiales bacterium]